MNEYLESWREHGDTSEASYVRFGDLEEILGTALSNTIHPKFDAVQKELLPIIRWFFGSNLRPEGYAIGNHAFNDFAELLTLLSTGLGRSAARAARALFEHGVHFCEVYSDLEAGMRYERHVSVSAQRQAKIRTGLDILSGRDYQVEARRLSNLGRDSLKDYRDALADYGHSFEKGWSATSLYDMSERHAKSHLYEVYRFLSEVTHGSAGGVLGTYRKMQGSGVHRTGLSLELSVLAFYHGVFFFREFIRDVMRIVEGVECGRLLGRLDDLLACWPDYRKILLAVDQSLWPSQPPASAIALVKAYETGVCRWYLYEPDLEFAFAADAPVDAGDFEAEAIMKARSTAGPASPSEGSHFVVATVPNISVTLKSGARPVPIRALLGIPDGAELPASVVDQI
ncbi:DUF5677 domain-containing protein [Amycolatopsis thermoflava]|uniref:DUF5677 domain-containing protein n=1 Tax=Amycolatopsis thermoflava TaxID=84480 RepID=UPI0011CDF013|nr:DUF5677 domain-containing protein [Amycolatopsis thermoflava]